MPVSLPMLVSQVGFGGPAWWFERSRACEQYGGSGVSWATITPDRCGLIFALAHCPSIVRIHQSITSGNSQLSYFTQTPHEKVRLLAVSVAALVLFVLLYSVYSLCSLCFRGL